MMMYHLTRFDSKRISNSENTGKKHSYLDYSIRHCDLDREEIEQFSLHNTPAHGDAQPYKFGDERLSG